MAPSSFKETDQTENGYQIQRGQFMFGKPGQRKEGGQRAKHGFRWAKKSVGLGFPTPKAAIKGNYVDKKCPFTSNVSIRGRILKGLVLSTKMKNTVVIRRDYLHWITKYKRYEKRHKNMSVHVSPAFENVGEGDILTVGQCRPLSKTVRFNALAHEPAINQSVSVKKQFRIF